ncbi:MAG: hypothetical protein WBY94_29730 [Polyangiaceae bacterium]
MPSPRRATFGQDVFDNLKAMFEQAPAAPPDEKPTEYSKLELVRGLAPTIGDLAKRGWSWKSLAAMMTQRGVAISADLLKAYFAQSQGKARRTRTKKKASAKNPTARPTRVGAPSAAAQNAVLEDASSWEEAAPSPKGAALPPVPTTQPAPARAVPVPPHATTGTKREPPRPSSDSPPGTFVIRPDTPDL